MGLGYRKKAYNKLSSPERLDQVLSVIKPGYWIAVVGALFLMIVLVIIACTYEYEVVSESNGICSSKGTVNSYTSNTNGIVTQIKCSQNDVVNKGQELFTFNNGSSVYTSPVSGKITSIRAKIGQQVTTNDNLVNIRTSSDTIGNTTTIQDFDPNKTQLIYNSYFPYDQIAFFKTGMKTHIVVTNENNETVGTIEGWISKIGTSVPTKEELMAQIGNEYLVETVTNMGAVVPVEISFDNETLANSTKYSNQSYNISNYVTEGSMAKIQVVTGTTRPIHTIMPS